MDGGRTVMVGGVELCGVLVLSLFSAEPVTTFGITRFPPEAALHPNRNFGSKLFSHYFGPVTLRFCVGFGTFDGTIDEG